MAVRPSPSHGADRTRTRAVGLLVACGVGCSALAAAGPAGAPFLNEPLSVAQTGMGGVGVGSGILEAWTNPALLAEFRPDGEVAFRGSSFFDQTESAFTAGAAWRINGTVVVGGVATHSAISFGQVDVFGNAEGTTFRHNDGAAGVTAAFRFETLHLGMSAREIVDALPQDVAQTAAVDLGMTAAWEELTGRLAVRNVGRALRRAEPGLSDAQVLPVEVRGGVSGSYAPAGLLGAIEVASRRDSTPIALGAAWSPSDLLTLHVGSADIATQGGRTYTFGFSYRYQAVTLEYSLVTQALGLTNHVGLHYAIHTSVPAPSAAEAGALTPDPRGDADRAYANAVIAYQGGDFACAVREAEACANADPERWQAWQLAGNARMALHDEAGALVAYERSLRIQPENRELATFVNQMRSRPAVAPSGSPNP